MAIKLQIASALWACQGSERGVRAIAQYFKKKNVIGLHENAARELLAEEGTIGRANGSIIQILTEGVDVIRATRYLTQFWMASLIKMFNKLHKDGFRMKP